MPRNGNATREVVIVRELRKWLKERNATSAFDELQPRCNPKDLALYLGSVGLAYGSNKKQGLPRNTFDDQVGFDRKELKTVIRRMRTCAKDLGRLRIQNVTQTLRRGYLRSDRHDSEVRKILSNLDSMLSWQSVLPYQLQQLAAATELAAKKLQFRRRRDYDEALASLVRYVHERTGRWHDEEVSALVGAVTRREYNTEAHRRWRMTHPNLYVR
jgi:hypothetical protein